MPSSDPIAVLFDAEDARAFVAARPPCRGVLTLTPDARAVCVAGGVTVISSSRRFSWRDHARTLAIVRRATNQVMDGCTGRLAENGAARETLRATLHHYAAVTVRAYRTLGTGPCLFPEGGAWVRVEDRRKATSRLLARLNRTPLFPVFDRPPAAGLARLASLAAAKLCSPSCPILFGNIDKGLAPFARELVKADHRLLGLRPSEGRWADTARAGIALLRALAGRRVVETTVVPASPDATLDQAARRALSAIDSEILSLGLAEFGRQLIRLAVDADALARGAVPLVKAANPRAGVFYSLRWNFDAALGEAAGAAGVRRILISHGTHPVPANAIAVPALDELARGLLVSPLADETLVQSPHADAAAAGTMADLPRTPIRPLVWGHAIARRLPPASGAKFRILHAGTYKTWCSFRPWVYETSDEYVDGLAALCEAVAAIDNVEMIVRVRPRPECSIDSLRQLLPHSDNITIKTSGIFFDDLAGADLLASFSSTTIEESLVAGVPVLLWGGGPAYRHLPAEMRPPTPANRAAVYAARTAHQLVPMLRGIVEAHREAPLTEAELAGHVWPPTVPDREYLAARLFEAAGSAAPRHGAIQATGR